MEPSGLLDRVSATLSVKSRRVLARPTQETTMYFGGIDAHRTYLTLAVVDKNGEVVEERSRVPIGDGEPMLETLSGPRPLEVVVGTCSFWPWICDTLHPTEIGFHLAHASNPQPARTHLS